MEASCLRQTELPAVSRLFQDFLYRFDRVERWFQGMGALRFAEERRAGLVAALAEQNASCPALDQLAQPGTCAIVTGQQVGLFSGPSYTIYKALTAARLAKQYTEQGQAAVPVFWLATEDHDLREVDHAWLFDGSVKPVPARVNLNGMPESAPVGPLAPSSWPLEILSESLSSFPYGAAVSQLVAEAYQPGQSFGSAFRRLLERLLAPYGFLFIDPLHPAVRRLAAPVLREAVLRADQLSARVLERNRELESAGYHAQVHFEPGSSLFFVLEGGQRVALRRNSNGYLTRDGRYSAEELAGRAEQLSPNALLRPVVQDFLLPTAAYVGGPAEIAYLAQSQVLYEALLGGMPRIVSRSGFTLLDRHARRLLQRYRLTLPEVFHSQEQLRERMAASLIDPALETEFAAAEQELRARLERLLTVVERFDPTLGRALEKSRSKMLYQLSKMRAKVAREALRRDAAAQSDADYLHQLIYPHGHLQERFYSILPFLARHGLDLIPQLYECVRLECPHHIVLTVD